MKGRLAIVVAAASIVAPALTAQRRGATRQDPAPWTVEYCALGGKPEIARMLLALGVDPNKPGVDGVTPLHEAAMKNHTGVVEVLVAHGAKVDAWDDAGETPLHEAALGGGVEGAEILLARRAEIDAKDRRSGATPLYYAALFGRTRMIQLLLRKGVSMNARNAKGVSVLEAAIQSGQTEAAELLRKADAVQ